MNLKILTKNKLIPGLMSLKVYTSIRSAEIPIIGAINGIAAGSGFQLALLTDIRVSHKKQNLAK